MLKRVRFVRGSELAPGSTTSLKHSEGIYCKQAIDRATLRENT